MRPVFIYGTLLDPRVFARFAGRAPLRRAQPAAAPGWQRAALRGTPYPTLRRGAGQVQGLLLPPLAPAALARLAAYEGGCYRLVPLRVMLRRGPRQARAWVAPSWRAALIPVGHSRDLRPAAAGRGREGGPRHVPRSQAAERRRRLRDEGETFVRPA